MGFRETMDEKPWIGAAAAGGLVLIAIIIAVWTLFGSSPGSTDDKAAAFSDDDGKTWFNEDSAKIAPFQHNGKEAVRAYIYESKGKNFVGYLERYTPEGKAAMEKLRGGTGMPDGRLLALTNGGGREVKRPGSGGAAGKWARGDTEEAVKIMDVKSPDGSSDVPTPLGQ